MLDVIYAQTHRYRLTDLRSRVVNKVNRLDNGWDLLIRQGTRSGTGSGTGVGTGRSNF